MPTDAMREEARRYRKWKKDGRKGGTDVAAKRASQILSGDELSDDTIVTMSAWFARHEVDKQAEGFSPGEEGYPSPGRVAWAAWGGDPGKGWADRLVAGMDRTMSELGERPYPNEHAARLRDPGKYDTFRRKNNEGGEGVDFIFGVKEGEEGAELQAIRFRADKFTATEARQWLQENDYDALEFEEATGERELRAEPGELSEGDFVSWNSSGGMARGQIEHVMREGTLGVPDSEFSINASEEDPAALIRIFREQEGEWRPTETLVGHRFSTLRKINSLRSSSEKRMHRSEVTEFRALGERMMEFPFSSEYPVARYFGNEVLSHEMSAAALERLNDGAPLLFNHDPDRIVGVVERAWVDGKKKRGYAKVRFSRNKLAQEVLDDVKDGILRGVSFGYSIDEMEEREGSMVATRWSPYEISVVSIPADPTVGMGRSLLTEETMQPEETKIEDEATESVMDEVRSQAAPAASPTPTPMENTTPDVEVIRSKAAEAERNRIAAINALGDKHQMQDLARELIDGGRTLDEARAAVLDKLGQSPVEQPIRSQDMTQNDLGLNQKEVKRFSFIKALNYLANPGDASARRDADFEIEVGKAAASKYERSSNGIVIPNEVLRRDLLVDIPTAGGNLVADELLAGSFIDLLRNRLALAQAGVTMLTGLQGNISIPRQTSAATAYWVGENVAPQESQQAIDQVNMTPKTVAAFVDYSRRLLLQSSIDVEGMIRNDLARVLALEIDRAGIYGTGSTNQPLGLINTTGIGTETLTNAGTFAQLIAMETDVAAANADAGSMRYIMNATARGALKSTSKAGNEAIFVWENNEVNGYPVIVSNQLLSNDALFGDFSQMVMGMWSGLDLMVDPYAGATAGTVRVIAHQDLDVAVKQPASFCFGT
jgi:HK97 family phage major capsid protein/HK97 family phage prohead protease